MTVGDPINFKDGYYITPDGAMINEGNMIEGAQSLDDQEEHDSSNYQLIYGIV